jgi:anti-sigma factor RsiW
VTSTTDTAGHPDVAEISDLTEGLLPPSRTADVRRHLDECELCADVHASLEEIRGLLGTLPGPLRMPDDVAGRIDAALAAEALLNATAPDGAATVTASDTDTAANAGTAMDAPALVGASRSASDADDNARVSRETSATTDRPAGHARTSTTGPGRKERTGGRRRRAAVLGAVFTVAALGLGSVLVSSLNDGKPSNPTAQGRQTATADTFSEGKLEQRVAGLLAKNQGVKDGSRPPQNSMGMEGGPSIASPRIFKQPTIPDCVRKGIGRNNASALATEQGTYKGTEALLVVLSDATDATRVTAYIVDATCVTQAPSTSAKVLFTHSYPRS